MRNSLVLSMIIAAALGVWAQDKGPKPVVSDKPLTAQQIAVYQAFLKMYDNGSGSPLNLGNTTNPLDISELKQGGGCLRGIFLEELKQAQNTVHRTEQLSADNLHIVDPKMQQEKVRENDPSTYLREGTKTVDNAVKDAFSSGLLTLSEIAFTKDRRWAVMSFGFRCGMLCGHGSLVVLHRVRDQWKPTQRKCGMWMS